MSTEPAQPRRRLPAAERRELIEQAAMDLFAERGYHGTVIDEIARRAGVTPPVLYDHFASKAALHQRLLERTRDELLTMWRTNLGRDETLEARVVRALNAWANYVRAHPYAPRMFFRETTGIDGISAVHRHIATEANGALAAIIGGLSGAEPTRELVMAAEVIRGGLTELATWWVDHPEVPVDAIVAAAMNTVWLGLERSAHGQVWRPAGTDEARPGAP